MEPNELRRPLGQFWPPKLQDGVPNLFDYRRAVGSLAPGDSVELLESIPANRLYGVLVALEDVTPGAEIEVSMWGAGEPGAFTKQMYLGTAKQENNYRDAFQQWRYRDSEGGRILRIRLANVGGVETALSLRIEAEPF